MWEKWCAPVRIRLEEGSNVLEQTGTVYAYRHPSGDVLAFTEYPLGEHSVVEVRPCCYQTFPPPRDRGGVWVDPCSGLAVNLYYLHVSCLGRDKDLF